MNWKAQLLKKIPRLPNGINLVLTAMNRDPTVVYGRAYRAYRKKLRGAATDAAAGEHLLIASVNDAIGKVPYYRRRYGGRTIRSVAEFEESIGFIDKDEVLGNYDDFLNRTIDLSHYDRGTTGGTSGKPLRLIAPPDRYVVELATMHSLWERAGYRFDVRGVIRNHRLDGREFMVNPLTREVIFDGFRLDEGYFRKVYRMMKRLQIRFVHCYPSTAYEFSTFLLRNGLDASFIKAFLSGSENIFDYQVELIQNRLGIRFYNWYGHSEKLVLAGYCETTNHYHIEPLYGYFELIDDKGGVIRERGRSGEIVGTSFHNPGMPLLRYRTGDYAEYVSDGCPACGRSVPVIRNVRGRWSGDRIYHADGSFVTTTALNLHNDLYSVINGIQYVQQEAGKLDVLVVRSDQYLPHHERALHDHFHGKLKEGTQITIRYVERLLRKPNGKFVHLISSVPSFGDRSCSGTEALRGVPSCAGNRTQ
jgi:phenylacetate-CoA ligase